MPRKCAYLWTPPEVREYGGWGQVARDHDLVVSDATMLEQYEDMKRDNPRVKTAQGVNPQIIPYIVGGDPWELAASSSWWRLPPMLQTSYVSRMREATRGNLQEKGVDWLLRWPGTNNPVWVHNRGVLANWTASCPRGRWGWTEGMTHAEASVRALEYVFHQERVKAAIDAVLCETHFVCWYSATGDGIPGYTGGCSSPNGGGYLTEAMRGTWHTWHVTVREKLPELVMILNSASMHSQGIAHRSFNGIKLELVGSGQGQRETFGDYATGIKENDQIVCPGYLCPELRGKGTNWSVLQTVDLARASLWIGLAMAMGDGYVAVDRNRFSHGATRQECPAFWDLTQWTPIRPFFLRNGCYLRWVKRGHVWLKLMVVNPNPYAVNGVAPESTAIQGVERWVGSL